MYENYYKPVRLNKENTHHSLKEQKNDLLSFTNKLIEKNIRS